MNKSLEHLIQDFHEYLNPLYSDIPPKVQMLMFIDGLPKDYQVDVHRNHPKTLEDAIRAAKYFDDTPKPSRSHQPSEPKKSFQFKRKDREAVNETHPNSNNPKKIKKNFKNHQGGKDIAEVRKKNMCIKCNGEGHLAQDCIKKSAFTSGNLSRSNEMDVWFLSSLVFGPHDLICIKGKVKEQVVNVLFDT
ncbi:hypothetical protein O6H91_03G091600 [Diphasiastrum complanatum]|uniref:Uncharacterized protein n=1 Tax=Diphasiastrum complanatum TaxID=34168 RepID=A0ACC2E916_DIPCM|nr:hypothetical protein O6H91_03G091600 [Diphasiastrum complanatum]